MKSSKLKLLSAVVTLVSTTVWAAPASQGDWPYYGGNIGFNRYSPLNIINPSNVKGLHVLWRRPGVDALLLKSYPDLSVDAYFRSTPIMIDGHLYASNGIGLVEAFDAATGMTLWVQQPHSGATKDLIGESLRGVAYWREGEDQRIISVRDEYLYCLDAKTGKSCPGFGNDGRVSLHRKTRVQSHFFMSGGPLVVGDVIVIGGGGSEPRVNDEGDQKSGTPESVRAYDVRTGRQLWSFSPRPAPDDPASATWGGGSGSIAAAMGAYGTLSADPELGYVYIPFSAPNPPLWGGWRPGNNEYGDSLVALDAKTGKKIWSFQMLHHDLWDHDLSSPPVLGDITVDGKRIKAVMQTGKQALLFTLDRVTGKPVWPVVETPVPQSTAPGEHSAPTQPIEAKPAPLDRQSVTEDDLIDFTPQLKQEALEIFRHYTAGPQYAPPTLYTYDEKTGQGNKGTLTLPGTDGGGNWNTGAFDPETGIYYAATETAPAAYALEKPTAPGADVDYWYREKGFWMVWGPHGLPLTKPPYGRITAVNMNSGDTQWVIPNGDGPKDDPLLKDLHLGQLGIPGRPALLVTKSLIFAGEGSDAIWMADQTKGYGNAFRAYEKSTGKVLATLQLPVGPTGAPITYSVNGKQFIVVAIAGMKHAPEWIALGL